MIVVIDASAAVKLVLHEQHTEQVAEIWDSPAMLLAPTIVSPEVASAIRAARADGRIDPAQLDAAHRSWAELQREIDRLNVDIELAEQARELAAARAVRGMDALYLAVAARFAEADDVALLSYDARQRAAVLPEDRIHLMPAQV